MRAPNPRRDMNLPPESMPWGRWVESGLEQNSDLLVGLNGGISDTRGEFNSRADNIAESIRGIGGLSNVTRVELPYFTRTYVGGIGAEFVSSPIVTIPLLYPVSSGFAFCSIEAEWISGGGDGRLGETFTTSALFQTGAESSMGSPLSAFRSEVSYAVEYSASVTTSFRNTSAVPSVTLQFTLRSLQAGTAANPMTVGFKNPSFTLVETGRA